MKISLILLIVSWLVQDDIDYSHKSLVREIQSFYSTDLSNLHRMDISGTGPEQSGRYFSVKDQDLKGYVYVGRANSCRSGGCSNGQSPAEGASEYFDYFILFDAGGVVRQVRVFNYQATHGHGITSRGWLKQFSGYDGGKRLEPGKDVDSISGATISVRSITAEVENRTRELKMSLASR